MNLIQLQPDDVLVVTDPQRLTTEQRYTAISRLRSVMGESQAVMVLDGGQTIEALRPATVTAPLEIKIDGMECMRKAMAPGAILLSVEAVSRLYGMLNEVRSPKDMNDLLVACGGIASTAESEYATPKEPYVPPVPYVHVWLQGHQVPFRSLPKLCPCRDTPRGREYAVPWEELNKEQRTGRRPIQPTT